MRPVAVLRFSRSEGPGRLGDWLTGHGVAWRLVTLDQGEPVPSRAGDLAGIGMMGGPMSANDPTPWQGPLAALLREAVGARVPVIGHCLGGQILARALGGVVGRARTTEIGWIDVEATDAAAAREWFGGRDRFTVFQWHYERYSLPPGAKRVLTNRWNDEQGYVLDERHIGLQCHVEMTRELVTAWCDMAPDELPARSTEPRQSREDIVRDLDGRVAALNALADGVYERWARGLAR